MRYEVSTKAALQRAINHMEQVYYGRTATDVPSLKGIAHADVAIRIALLAAVGQHRSTCVLSESFSPAQVLLHMLCIQGGVRLEDVADRRLKDADFTRLSCAAAKLSAAPLHLAACGEVCGIEQTAWDLLAMTNTHKLEVLVCEKRSMEGTDDWRSELEFLSRMSGIRVHLLAGRYPAQGGFNREWRQTA
ncbi:MAG: hypothetical protein NT167_31860 [Verrucomicrobia bacterium]|jgi:hypothetical protein|nr:hypothetical protein [Verrucomicrobiota bacterium]